MSLRTRSLLVLLLVYLLAGAFGWAVWKFLPLGDPVWSMLAGDLAATLVVWLFGVILDNSSVYDPYWSVVPPFLLLGWAVSLGSFPGTGGILLFLAVTLWAFRLTANWFRGWKDFSVQDWRYVMIRKEHPRMWFLANLFGINLMPTLIVFFQMAGSWRFLAAAPQLDFWILFGFCLCLAAVVIQSVSDRQMEAFRRKNAGKGKCIDEGLWRYSRHPNYFGEVAMWWGVWLITSGGTGNWDLWVLAPILMTALFLFISIPMMERKILSTRPQYRQYQRRVSILVPFFPRSGDNDASVAGSAGERG